MALVCRSCFSLEEPQAVTGPLGYALWLIGGGIGVGACAGAGEAGLLIGPVALVVAGFLARTVGIRLVCPGCLSGNLVSPASPAGMQIIRDHARDLEAIASLRAAAPEAAPPRPFPARQPRELCPDGACVGLIGINGKCRECGRAAPSARALGMRDLQVCRAVSDPDDNTKTSFYKRPPR